MVEEISDVSGTPVLVVATSDGAGSARHADIASKELCRHALTLIRRSLSAGATVADLTEEVARGWIRELRAQLVSESERLGCPLRELSATFVAAIIGQSRALFMQVGDGGIVVHDAETEPTHEGWSFVFWPSKGDFANTTNFVTDEDSDVAAQVDTSSAPHDVAVFTDGIEHLVLHFASRSAHAPFFESMFRPVRSATSGGPQNELSTALADFLGSAGVQSRTDDDVTLVLASRSRAVGSLG